jgi:uncharacterized protein (DUF1697 family)
MASMRAWLEALGFAEVRTLLQTGNLVFRGGRRRGAALERYLEEEAAGRLSLTTDFMVRTPSEWAALIADNPFPKAAAATPARLHAFLLKRAPARPAIAALEAAAAATGGPEEIHVHGATLYAFYPDGMGRSKLTGALIDRALGVRGTARNWNTVLKLAALAKG